jgi:hypothetical protein
MFPLTYHSLNHKAESMELHDSEVREVLEFYIDLVNIQKIFPRMLDRIRLYTSNKIKKKFTNEMTLEILLIIDIYLQFCQIHICK